MAIVHVRGVAREHRSKVRLEHSPKKSETDVFVYGDRASILEVPEGLALNSPEEEVYEYPSLSREGLREEGAYPVKAYKADRIDELPYQLSERGQQGLEVAVSFGIELASLA